MMYHSGQEKANTSVTYKMVVERSKIRHTCGEIVIPIDESEGEREKGRNVRVC